MAERLAKGDAGAELRPEAWTPDGKTLAFVDSREAGDIWTLTIGGDQKPKPLVQTSNNERYAKFSPNGCWFGYTSGDRNTAASGFQVFVQPYPPTGAKYQLSTDGGRNLVWSPDGKQVFYASTAGPSRITTVDIRTEPSFSFGKAVTTPVDRAVWIMPGTNYDITPDAKQFVVVVSAAPGSDPTTQPTDQINVVLNWLEELKQRVPVK